MTEATKEKEETANESVDLSKESQKVIETVESMTVLELSKLVKALEDKFGVVAAPVAVAGAAPAAGGDAGDDAAASSTVSVVLTSCGDKKIQVLKAVRELTGLGLKEAKELVDNVPKPVKEGIEKEEANTIKKQLEEQGAQVEIK
ncbi:MAG: 50S ribosomal protein L7/L12 [Actinobacteria bacterium]|nr:50S ribosomal protein L7/L12 [Actinomycetota bacterium]|tara:strand:+ start:232 stop:666 length:435 start_codon:yes stop_codon:yes gene_type:complete